MTVDLNVISENLAELLTNTVNMTSVYYDIYLNPEPMDVELKQFNANNELVTITIPNRAKDRRIALSGEGSPEGVVDANLGASYVDETNRAVYFKAQGSGNTGWAVVMTQEGVETYVRNYLAQNDFVTQGGLASYLVTNNYVNQTTLTEAFNNYKPSIRMNAMATSGTVALEDNQGYYVTPTGALTLVLPSITDYSTLHKIFIQVNMTSVVTISLGTSLYFDNIEPEFGAIGMYNIMYEFDNARKVWVAGVMAKGSGLDGTGALQLFDVDLVEGAGQWL